MSSPPILKIRLGALAHLDVVRDTKGHRYLLVLAEGNVIRKREVVVLEEDQARRLGWFLLGRNVIAEVRGADVDEDEVTMPEAVPHKIEKE